MPEDDRSPDPERSRPFGPGSVSLGLHPLTHVPVLDQVGHLLDQASAARDAGFDGVTISEHHAGFESYLPQPFLACTWILEQTPTIWAAPLPLLLGLRNPMLVAEELAWTAARHPGRVALAVAPGYAASDFHALGVEHSDRIGRFRRDQTRLVDALSATGPLEADPAITRWASDPAPVLSATNSVQAVDLAADAGLGIVFPGSETPDRLARLTDRYRARGGGGPVVWIRSSWLGEPPRTDAAERLASAYRASAAAGMRQSTGFRSSMATGTADQVVDELVTSTRNIGATGINVRLHVAGVDPAAVVEQIDRFGREVLPVVRAEALP